MGCDIHTYVEKKVEGVWQPVEGLNPYYEMYPSEQKYVLEGWIYRGRDYGLFSLLADVRNYDDIIAPLDEPRGVPTDASVHIAKEAKRWGSDGHSHSYFTLSELQAADPETQQQFHQFFIADTVPKLITLSQGDPDSVRFVFWFDN